MPRSCPRALPETVSLVRAGSRQGEVVERFRFDRVQEFLPLRRKAARWAVDRMDDLRDADPRVPDQLHDRGQDNARAICGIADVAGARWPKLVREALVGSAAQADDEPQSPGVLLLRSIDWILRARRREDVADPGQIGSSELVAKLCAIPDSPWAEWRGGKPISPQGVAKYLRPFGVKPVQDRHGSYYRTADFADALTRYLPSPAGTTATTATTATATATATEIPNHINENGSCGSCGSYSRDAGDNCHRGSSKEYSDEQIDRAVNGAVTNFAALNDITNPDAWA